MIHRTHTKIVSAIKIVCTRTRIQCCDNCMYMYILLSVNGLHGIFHSIEAWLSGFYWTSALVCTDAFRIDDPGSIPTLGASEFGMVVSVPVRWDFTTALADPNNGHNIGHVGFPPGTPPL
ncbi:hypothetical protein DPMN_094447 [Dreissena polymorpha]|uniref:Uncharacterized protein n=1 Tax=Dreissena polymorpha TaxID=45954 RepID=A0A9D4L4S3_DREPO|nr:hypothetical protein DPMN_094447 [Dreissena polymorpha]